jgi:hypothetical protein
LENFGFSADLEAVLAFFVLVVAFAGIIRPLISVTNIRMNLNKITNCHFYTK